MGYQESLIKVNNSKDFNEAVKYIQSNKEDLEIKGVYPATVVELKKDLSISADYMLEPGTKVNFKEGEKLICITGDRYHQNCVGIFENDWDLLTGTGVYFIECFPCDELFKKDSTLAKEVKFEDYVKELEPPVIRKSYKTTRSTKKGLSL